MGNLAKQQRYVRVTDIRGDGFVEFDFSVGDPELYVELIMPQPAFQEFCAANDVVHLSEADAARVDADRKKWREAGL